jgi:hypothetical protein
MFTQGLSVESGSADVAVGSVLEEVVGSAVAMFSPDGEVVHAPIRRAMTNVRSNPK